MFDKLNFDLCLFFFVEVLGRIFDHFHEPRDFFIFHRTTDIARGRIARDESLEIRVHDRDPWNATAFAAKLLGQFGAILHFFGIDFDIDIILCDQGLHDFLPEELLEKAAIASPGCAQVDE